MKNSLNWIWLIPIVASFVSCTTETEVKRDIVIDDEIWLLPKEEVRGELDPFELINMPSYLNVSEVDFLKDDDPVMVYKGQSEQVYVYPNTSMLVELVNDIIDGVPVAINYCPLTHTGMAWDRRMAGDTVLLTASGYLYRDNLVLYDSLSGSLWSQMKIKAIHGDYNFIPVKTLPLLQTTWGTVKRNFKGINVFSHQCDEICEGRNNNPNNNDFDDYEPGDLIYGIVGASGSVASFGYEDFEEEPAVINVQGQGYSAVLIGSKKDRYITAFKSQNNFERVENAFPVVMKDDSGTLWNIFGVAVEGPGKGQRLEAANSYFAYGHAWKAIFGQ